MRAITLAVLLVPVAAFGDARSERAARMRAETQAKMAELEAKQEQKLAELKTLLAEKALASIAVGAKLCALDTKRAIALDTARRAKGGTDIGERWESGDRRREIDELNSDIRLWSGFAKRWKVKAASCGNSDAKTLGACLFDDECVSEKYARHLRLLELMEATSEH
jgi:uncharacterized coiled-coil protein SlyX